MKADLKTDNGFTMALGAMLALALFAFVALNAGLVLRSPDLLWHTKTGLTILTDRAVPWTDIFSHSYEGQMWIAKEWLAQVILALAYLAAGWPGTLVLTGASVALAGWMLYSGMARHIHPLYAALLVIAGYFFSFGVIVARPHILTFPLAAGLTLMLFGAARRQQAPPFWSLILFVLWTNFHGSFAIAFMIGGCALFDYLERARFSNRRTLTVWIAYLALAALSTLINPYFIKPFEIAVSMAHGMTSMIYVAEWAAFKAPDQPLMEAGLMLFLLLVLKTRPKLTFGQILLALVALHMMLLHVRFLYVFFLLVPLVLVADLAEAFPAMSKGAWSARPRDGLEALLQRYAKIVCLIAAVVFVAASSVLIADGTAQPAEASAIRGAIAYVETHKASEPALQKKVYNAYEFGGALILAGIKTYIDGRAEQLFYGDFLEQYIASEDDSGIEALRTILARPDIGWAIIPAKGARQDHLQQLPDWKQVYADDVAAIWEKTAS